MLVDNVLWVLGKDLLKISLKLDPIGEVILEEKETEEGVHGNI